MDIYKPIVANNTRKASHDQRLIDYFHKADSDLKNLISNEKVTSTQLNLDKKHNIWVNAPIHESDSAQAKKILEFSELKERIDLEFGEDPILRSYSKQLKSGPYVSVVPAIQKPATRYLNRMPLFDLEKMLTNDSSLGNSTNTTAASSVSSLSIVKPKTNILKIIPKKQKTMDWSGFGELSFSKLENTRIYDLIGPQATTKKELVIDIDPFKDSLKHSEKSNTSNPAEKDVDMNISRTKEVEELYAEIMKSIVFEKKSAEIEIHEQTEVFACPSAPKDDLIAGINGGFNEKLALITRKSHRRQSHDRRQSMLSTGSNGSIVPSPVVKIANLILKDEQAAVTPHQFRKNRAKAMKKTKSSKYHFK